MSLLDQEKQMMVYVERRVADDASLSKDEAFGSIRNQLCTFREGETLRMSVQSASKKNKDKLWNVKPSGIYDAS